MSFDNLETILITFANKVLDAKNGVTNPTLGELIDEPLKAIQQAHNKAVNEARVAENQRYIDLADEFNNRTPKAGELTASSFGSAGAGMVASSYYYAFKNRISQLSSSNTGGSNGKQSI